MPFLLFVHIGIFGLNPDAYGQSEVDIPEWVKKTAGWWANNEIDDNSFVQGIQFLIKQGIMDIPPTTQGNNSSSDIPEWVKKTAGWWANNEIDDNSFVQGIQFLIKQGIMDIPPDTVPIADTDGDNILDDVDQCINEPETINQFKDSDGCPDTVPIADTDGDNILDDVDQCINEPETINQFKDSDGCPDTVPIADTDGDNILDDVDQCINEPETINQFKDSDGCPDTIILSDVVEDNSLTISDVEITTQSSGWGDQHLKVSWTYFVEHTDSSGEGFPSKGHFVIEITGIETIIDKAEFDEDNKFTGEFNGIDPGIGGGPLTITVISFIGDDRGNYVGDGDEKEIFIPPYVPEE